jgi:hypothetical protein
MKNKRIQLPKEGVAGSDDLRSEFIDESNDVQGHGFPNPAPPAAFTRRGSGHGGEAIPPVDVEDDLKGHPVA